MHATMCTRYPVQLEPSARMALWPAHRLPAPWLLQLVQATGLSQAPALLAEIKVTVLHGMCQELWAAVLGPAQCPVTVPRHSCSDEFKRLPSADYVLSTHNVSSTTFKTRIDMHACAGDESSRTGRGSQWCEKLCANDPLQALESLLNSFCEP